MTSNGIIDMKGGVGLTPTQITFLFPGKRSRSPLFPLLLGARYPTVGLNSNGGLWVELGGKQVLDFLVITFLLFI